MMKESMEKFWYTIIHGNENESFSLNHETGILYPGAALLGRAGSYRIEVEARDGAGNGPHSDKCYVDIRVTPVNQHKPQFVLPELTMLLLKYLRTQVF